jgi:hypothetical protein
LKEIDVDGRITLSPKFIWSIMWGGELVSPGSCIKSCGGLFLTQQQIFGFLKSRRISWAAERLTAFPDTFLCHKINYINKNHNEISKTIRTHNLYILHTLMTTQ